MQPLTVELQKRDIDIASAFQMVQLLQTNLNDIRNNIDRHHNIWYMEACNMGRSAGTMANKFLQLNHVEITILLKMFWHTTED